MRVWILNIMIVVFSLVGVAEAFGQQKQLVQFTGVIKNSETEAVVPYVTIINKTFRGQVFTSNHQGYFSFVAHPGDTISFSSIGYDSGEFVIPSNAGEKFAADIQMTSRAFELEAVYPYPWASIDEFNEAFLALEVADDNFELARKNLNSESIMAMARTLPRNGQEMRVINTNQQHFRLANKNTNERMSNPLLNPFAWGNLIRQITEGNQSRSKNNW